RFLFNLLHRWAIQRHSGSCSGSLMLCVTLHPFARERLIDLVLQSVGFNGVKVRRSAQQTSGGEAIVEQYRRAALRAASWYITHDGAALGRGTVADSGRAPRQHVELLQGPGPRLTRPTMNRHQ